MEPATFKGPLRTGSAATISAMVVLVVLVLGRVGGLVRDLVVAPLFGAGAEVDALVAARTVPELFLALVTSGAVTAGFLPALSYLSGGKDRLPADGVKAISVISNWLVLITVFFAALGILFPRALLAVATPGIDGYTATRAAFFLRVMMPVVVLVTVAAIQGAHLNFHGRFALPMARVAVTNVTIILLTILFARSWGIVAVAVGWVIGAMLQLVILLPAMARLRVQYRLSFDLRADHVRYLAVLMLPIVLAQLLDYGRILVERQFGSLLPEGSLACLNYALRIGTAPVLIVVLSVSTVFFPLFSRLAASGDEHGLVRSIAQSFRLSILGISPFLVVFSIFPDSTVSLLLGHGAFGAEDIAITARLLRWYSLTLVGASVTAMLSQVLYAEKRGGAALAAAAAGVAVQVVATVLTVSSLGVVAVPIGTGLGYFTTSLVLATRVKARLPLRRDQWTSAMLDRVCSATLIMWLAAFGMRRLGIAVGFPVRFPFSDVVAFVCAGTLYVAMLWGFGIPEIRKITIGLKRKISRSNSNRRTDVPDEK